MRRYSHKKWMWVLVFGFVWYLAMHFLMTLAALDMISVYAVPIILLLLAVVFIIVTVILRKKQGYNGTHR